MRNNEQIPIIISRVKHARYEKMENKLFNEIRY